MPAPLFVKYRTESETPYVYDLSTGSILKVDDVIYAILDDFRILLDNELVEKYQHLGTEAVLQALEELYEIRNRNILLDHEPSVPDRCRRVFHERETYSVRDFLASNHSCLILGITEKCNLRCEYCVFGEHYPRYRAHSDGTMSREIAERAIVEYLNHTQENIPGISFFGGEPLLEFGLIRQIVEFAEDYGERLGKKPFFSLTTNGTLLTDEKTKFFVEHNISVIVSLDGPREVHDRYRVFRNTKGSNRRVGSFDIVMRNMERFMELYPDYLNRGFNTVLCRPFDLEGTRELFDKLVPHYPIGRLILCQEEYGDTFSTREIRPIQSGCAPALECESCTGSKGCSSEGTLYQIEIPRTETSETPQQTLGLAEEHKDGARPDEIKETIRGMSEEESRQIRSLARQYQADRIRFGSKSMEGSGFVNAMYTSNMITVHNRVVTDQPLPWKFSYNCIPGIPRLFCDSRGRYYVCEKAAGGADTVALGDVWNGFNAERGERLMEVWRHLGDCANCIAQKTCGICFVAIAEQKNGEAICGESFEFQCQRSRLATKTDLKMYTGVLEKNPQAFDELDTSLFYTRIHMAGMQEDRGVEEVGLEELAGYGAD